MSAKEYYLNLSNRFGSVLVRADQILAVEAFDTSVGGGSVIIFTGSQNSVFVDEPPDKIAEIMFDTESWQPRLEAVEGEHK